MTGGRRVVLGVIAVAVVSGAARADVSPKLELRTVTSYVQNESQTSPESFLAVGGLDLAFHLFLTRKLSVGVGYTASFDVSRQDILLHGLDASIRYYWWGSGTRVVRSDPWVTVETRSALSAYAGVFGSQRSYNPGPDQGGNARPSTSATFGGLSVGLDYPLSPSFDFNAEFGVALVATKDAATRDRFFTHSLRLGVAYLF